MLQVSTVSAASESSHNCALSSAVGSLSEAPRKEPLLLQSLNIERRLLLEQSFVPAPVETGGSALEMVATTRLMIGVHRFEHVTFYVAPQVDMGGSSGGRRSSLSLLHMFLAPPGTSEAGNNSDSSAASASIKEMLVRNPGLAQLLTSAASLSPLIFAPSSNGSNGSSSSSSSNNLNTSERRPSIVSGFKSRDVYFSLIPNGPLFVFPRRALISCFPLGDLHVKFIPACLQASSPSLSLSSFSSSSSSFSPSSPPCSLLIIQHASEALVDLLFQCTRDPIHVHGDYLGKISQLPAVAYREICFPCVVPTELGAENLVKQLRSSDHVLNGTRGRGSSLTGSGKKRPNKRRSKNGGALTNGIAKTEIQETAPSDVTHKTNGRAVSSLAVPVADSSISMNSALGNVRRSLSVGTLQPQFVPIKKRKYLIRSEAP